jgi:biotin carboxylase
LLVLGAGHFQVPVIRRGKELGCQVIAMDYLPDNPGHRMADESLCISTVDVEAVLAAARDLGIDGVLTYGSDVSAPTVTVVAEALGLPGNPATAGRILQRKDLFRAFQSSTGLPHPPFTAARRVADFQRGARHLRFPLIVKPADSSGSKGQSLVSSSEEVAVAFDLAMPFSRCGVVVAEEVLVEDLPELVGDVWISSGALSFRQYGHNYFNTSEPIRVPVGEIVPGTFSREVTCELDRQLAILISGLGLRCGCLNFDGMVAGGEVYLLDIGLRNGGNFLPELIELSTGFDLTAAAIHSALGVPFSTPAALEERPALSYVLGARKAGVLRSIEIADTLRPHLARQTFFTSIGSRVEPFTRGDRALGVLFFTFPTGDDALLAAATLCEAVRVVVE